ncbi:hypothetical protein EON63_13285, partial [archaeon]
TIYHTPYTIYHIPYTIYHILYTIYHIPYTIYHIPYTPYTRDYQIQVHVIEARELKAENYDGTSDPIVFVECFKQKRNTRVVNNVTSAVYDELFIFNVSNVTKDMFEQATIRISCYDSNMLSSQGMVCGYFWYGVWCMMVYGVW